MKPTPDKLYNALSPPTSRFRSRLRKSHKEALEKILPMVELPADRLLSFEDIFGREAPVYLEIGFGNGEFLYNSAINNPEADFIGIEFFLTGVSKLLRRLTDYGRLEQPSLRNLRIIPGDARLIVPDILPDESLNGIFILFPDPWPKKRHHKRRLIKSEFLQLLYKKLKTQGFLLITTDNEDYALWIEDSFREARISFLINDIDLNIKADIFSTKYAREAIISGRNIFVFKAVKSDNLMS